ncbi:hypothetical protein E4H04_10090 [Candidatus Bathyarchaeota archaeon]|jgi:hypothetical protein|nr:MAG: hypothetical protein E4H04_10090 [Candidatus Bathyarchaeota archaeon]
MKSTFSVELKDGAQVSSLYINSKDVLIEGVLGEITEIILENSVFTLTCCDGTLRFDVPLDRLVRATRRKKK